MNEATRKEACENLKTLRKQRSQVAKWYGNMKTNSTDAWNQMKNGFSDAYKALENAWRKSEKNLVPENRSGFAILCKALCADLHSGLSWPNGIVCLLSVDMLSFGDMRRVTASGVRRVKAVLDQWVRDPPG